MPSDQSNSDSHVVTLWFIVKPVFFIRSRRCLLRQNSQNAAAPRSAACRLIEQALVWSTTGAALFPGHAAPCASYRRVTFGVFRIRSEHISDPGQVRFFERLRAGEKQISDFGGPWGRRAKELLIPWPLPAAIVVGRIMEVRGMTLFDRLGGRGSVGVRGMTLFNRLGGRASVGFVG